MKRLISVLSIISLFLLFGCTNTEPKEDSSVKVGFGGYANLRSGHIIADDCEVLCVAYIGGYGGGLSCDWDNKICEED